MEVKPEEVVTNDDIGFGAWEGFRVYIPEDRAYEQNCTVVPTSKKVVSGQYGHDDGFMTGS